MQRLFDIQPVLLRTSAVLFGASVSSTFVQKMVCCTTLLLALVRQLAALTGHGRLWYGRRKKGEGSFNPAIPVPTVSKWLMIGLLFVHIIMCYIVLFILVLHVATLDGTRRMRKLAVVSTGLKWQGKCMSMLQLVTFASEQMMVANL